MGKAITCIALLLLLASFANAQPPPMPNVCNATQIGQYWDARFDSWVELCLIGMMISLLMVSSIYMLSQFLGNPGASAWCKKEIFEIAVTGVIFAGILGFVGFSCTVRPHMFFPAIPDTVTLFDYALDPSNGYMIWLREVSYKLYIGLAFLNSLIKGVADTFVRSSPGGYGIDLSPMQGLGVFGGLISFSMNSIMVGGIITTLAQIRVLRVSQIMMFNILLPIGLIARCFEPTRRFGGSLIAIAIGFFLFYPFLILLNGVVIKDNLLLTTDVDSSLQMGGINYDNQISLGAARDRYVDSQDNLVNPYFDTATGPGYVEAVDPANPGSYHSVFYAMYEIAFKILVATLFLPLLNFLLIISFVRNLSRVLGEEVDVSNITQMI